MPKKLTRKQRKPKVSRGRGWVGMWPFDENGALGWGMPQFLGTGSAYKPFPGCAVDGKDRLVLCEITVRPIRDKAGRYIYRNYEKALKGADRAR